MLLGIMGKYNRPKCFIWAILLLGTALRVVVFFQNRSFIIDESNLARNVVENNFVDFFLPLDYEQYAPPLFLVANKLMTLIFGVHEYSLTFISLLAGIGSLYFLYRIAELLRMETVSVVYILVLFSFSILAIRYSTEFKQYAFDSFLTLVFLCWILKKKTEYFDFKFAIYLSILGGIAIWASMSIIFSLATIGLYLFYMYMRNRSIHFASLVLVGLTWLVSFTTYFFWILQSDANSDYLQNFHHEYFFNLLPTNIESAKRSMDLILGLFRSVTDKTVVSLLGTLGVFIYGGYQLIRRAKQKAFLLLMPIGFCLLTSHFGMYSLLTRLTLFLIPLIMLVFSHGLSELWKKTNVWFQVVLVSFMLLTAFNKKGYQYFWIKMEFEDAKTAMDYLKVNRLENEVIYVYHSGVPSFVFYNEYRVGAPLLKDYYYAKWDETPGHYFLNNNKVESGDIFWLYFTHTNPEKQLNSIFHSLRGKAIRLEEHRGEQSIVMKYIFQ